MSGSGPIATEMDCAHYVRFSPHSDHMRDMCRDQNRVTAYSKGFQEALF
jgi:hypothetical protein